MTGPRRPVGGRGRRSHGFTLVETTVSIAILAVGALTAASVLATSLKLDEVNRENSAAFAAARAQIECIRSEPFSSVLATFDADPANDPGGAATAPGAVLSVGGTVNAGALGAIENAIAAVQASLSRLGPRNDATVTVLLPIGPGGAVREDLIDAELGLPRDLNGDNVVDALDHRADAIVLPVGVRVTWTGRQGPRSVVLTTMVHE